jgi:hypothetical protein
MWYVEWDQHEEGWTLSLIHALFLLDLFFDSEYGGDIFLRNAGWLPTTTRRYEYIPEKIELLITTAVRTSNHINFANFFKIFVPSAVFPRIMCVYLYSIWICSTSTHVYLRAAVVVYVQVFDRLGLSLFAGTKAGVCKVQNAPWAEFSFCSRITVMNAW